MVQALKQFVINSNRPYPALIDHNHIGRVANMISLFSSRLLVVPEVSTYFKYIAEGYLSLTTLRWHKQIPEITVSTGVPSATEFNPNITAFLGKDVGHQPPGDPRLGQVIMIDGVALEEVIRFDLGQNCLLGLCREHSQIKKTVDNVGNIEAVKRAISNGECHHRKDGTSV